MPEEELPKEKLIFLKKIVFEFKQKIDNIRHRQKEIKKNIAERKTTKGLDDIRNKIKDL